MSQWIDSLASLIDKVSVKNTIVLAILTVVAIPSVFMWRFMTDQKFRHEFISSVEVLDDMKVPCTVVMAKLPSHSYRYLIGTVYEIRGRLEYGIVVRSPGLLADAEVATACSTVHDAVNLMKAAMRDRDAQATEGK